jgi:hypothetical protein
MDNIKFVSTLMESTTVGPLAQIVVMTAIDNYTSQISKMTPEQLKKHFPDTGIFNADSWHQTCAEIQEKIVNRNKQ